MPDTQIQNLPLITEPGSYDGMSNEAYHSHCTPAPALSSSGARTLLTDCPAAYWHSSPLNPLRQPERKREFDIGTAGHLIVLEPHLFDERVSIIDADSYRTSYAKEAREQAYGAGKTPLLAHEVEAVKAMRDQLLKHPVARLAFTGRVTERSYFWIDHEFGVWRKCRPDYTPPHTRYLTDYKTTTDAHPARFARSAADLGYHMQAAWYMDCAEVHNGERPKDFYFVVQEKKAPFLVSVVKLDDEAIQWGRIQNRKALDLFARCVERNEWPSYANQAVTISLPPYIANDLQKRHEKGEFVTSRDVHPDAPLQAAE